MSFQVDAQHDTAAIPLTSPAGQPYPPDQPAAGTAQVDAAWYWHNRFRRERTKSRVLIAFALALGLLSATLSVATWQLAQSSTVASQIAAASGLGGLLDDAQPATPTEPEPDAVVPAPSAGAQDLAELQQLAEGLRNDDGSINPLGIAALAGKLSTLAQEPERLPGMIDQAEEQGIIDPMVAGLLRGLLASQGPQADDGTAENPA